jgi:hypothetical protein
MPGLTRRVIFFSYQEGISQMVISISKISKLPTNDIEMLVLFILQKRKKRKNCYPFLLVRTAEKLYKAYASQKPIW